LVITRARRAIYVIAQAGHEGEGPFVDVKEVGKHDY